MKKVLATLVLAAATIAPAFAHHGGPHHGHHFRHGHHHHGYWHHGRWVAPLVIGAGVTYWATRPDPVIIREQPVIVEQPTVDPATNCTPWRETQQSDGTVVRERTCYPR